MRTFRVISLAAGLVLSGVLSVLMPARILFAEQAGEGPSVVVTFDFEAREHPEGLAVDAQGNVYVGMAPTGEIKQVRPDGSVSTFARLPDGPVLGLAYGMGCLFALVASGNPETHGIWCVAPDGRFGEPPFAPLDPAGFPNAITLGAGPIPFVTDSVLGRIWTFRPEVDAMGRFAPTGIVWLEDPLLAGNPQAFRGFPVGANGISYRDGYLYVANTDYGRILRIPVVLQMEDLEMSAPRASPFPFPSPQPGPIEIFVEDPALNGADDIAFDSLGSLYVAVNAANRLVRISPNRDIAILAEGEPLQFPASLAFGAGADRESLFITNYPILQAMGIAPGIPRPALLKMPVGVAGQPMAPPFPPAPGVDVPRPPDVNMEMARCLAQTGDPSACVARLMPALLAMPPMPSPDTRIPPPPGVSEEDWAPCLVETGSPAECVLRLTHRPSAPAAGIGFRKIAPTQGTVLERGTEVTFEADVFYSLVSADSGRLTLVIQDQDGKPLEVSPQPPVRVERGMGAITISGMVQLPRDDISALAVIALLLPEGQIRPEAFTWMLYLVR